jgi:aryl-alcohol dehydrogenase-like predicted oxidoreductase
VRDGARFQFLHRLPGMSGSQAALAYVLADPAVSSAVVGTTRLSHLKEDTEASGLELPPEVMVRINAAQARRI